MIPKSADIVARAKLTRNEMQAWCRTEFQIPDFTVQLILKGPGTSLGGIRKGRPFMKICVGELLNAPVQAFTEYKSFNARYGVGGFETTEWTLYLDTLIAHEISHAVQHYLITTPQAALKRAGTDRVERVGRKLRRTAYFEGLGQYEGGHGDFFLTIYRKLRDRFINERVPRSSYTNPRKRADLTVDCKATQHPLVGKTFVLNGRTFTVVAKRAESNRAQYGYSAEDGGVRYRVKITDMAKGSPEIMEIINGNLALRRELEAITGKIASRARAQTTRNARAGGWRWAA